MVITVITILFVTNVIIITSYKYVYKIVITSYKSYKSYELSYEAVTNSYESYKSYKLGAKQIIAMSEHFSHLQGKPLARETSCKKCYDDLQFGCRFCVRIQQANVCFCLVPFFVNHACHESVAEDTALP